MASHHRFQCMPVVSFGVIFDLFDESETLDRIYGLGSWLFIVGFFLGLFSLMKHIRGQ